MRSVTFTKGDAFYFMVCVRTSALSGVRSRDMVYKHSFHDALDADKLL